MKKYFVVLFVNLVLFFVGNAQPLSQQEKEILQLQDQRSLGDGKLILYLHADDPHLRFLAVRALANIQDTSSVHVLIPLLSDSAVEVRTITAFALGQIGGDSAERALFRALYVERNLAVLARAFEALGKCGSNAALDSVVKFSDNISHPIFQSDVALSLARFAIRDIKSERAIWKCFDYLYSADASVRANALYALWRCAPHGLLDIEIAKHKELLDSLSRDRSADIRLNCILVLGHSQLIDAAEIIKNRMADLLHETDWRVRVSLVRALGVSVTASSEMLHEYAAFLSDPNDHVTIAALQSLAAVSPAVWRDSATTVLLKNKIIALADSSDEAVRGEALITLGRFFPDELRRYPLMADSSNASSRLRAKYLAARAQIINKLNFSLVVRNLDNADVLVAMTAWESLHNLLMPRALSILQLDSAQAIEFPQAVAKKIATALSKNDIGVTTLVANFCADTIAFASLKKANLTSPVGEELIAAFKRLHAPEGIEAMQAVVGGLESISDARAIAFLETLLQKGEPSVAAEAKKILKAITGKNYTQQLPVSNYDEHSKKDWKLLEEIKPHQHVLLTTTKGSIVLELMKGDAPFTVLSFVKLIQKHFYDGLTFHRVVPNFVVQGGDLRGDGWGGPDFILRTETSLATYSRGSLGMASAGKDTEGSQFFITHTATPHLDGRYTIFGKVAQGMDIVDRLQIGDKILSLQLAD